MVLDVFIRQITKEALDRLQENLILVVRMPPANNTYLFQPLNLTVNGSATAFIKKFQNGIVQKSLKTLDHGLNLDDLMILK